VSGSDTLQDVKRQPENELVGDASLRKQQTQLPLDTEFRMVEKLEFESVKRTRGVRERKHDALNEVGENAHDETVRLPASMLSSGTKHGELVAGVVRVNVMFWSVNSPESIIVTRW
jgi:hypothetical protein